VQYIWSSLDMRLHLLPVGVVCQLLPSVPVQSYSNTVDSLLRIFSTPVIATSRDGLIALKFLHTVHTTVPNTTKVVDVAKVLRIHVPGLIGDNATRDSAQSMLAEIEA